MPKGKTKVTKLTKDFIEQKKVDAVHRKHTKENRNREERKTVASNHSNKNAFINRKNDKYEYPSFKV